ncbi:hypothetical protein LOTGIDRAFT_158729 [Lottia gigantea]|uniref:Macroglobulin domain-containing protein n=1 Tax=Lottia gigantea TaxID=225164 RepID=V4A4D7_LOTGI|nr:hypothetical protein LOTGIDRAFT_158729 [Lottia gigantea]ESO98783.1 hypothetical protein LOTGIDRAFT_158729 [Lottia gigantea]
MTPSCTNRSQDARYMILSPRSIHACVPYSFSAKAYGNHSYTLKAELQRSYSGNTISSITTEILPGDTKLITLPVPCNLTSWSIYLILTGTGETTFNGRQYLNFNRNRDFKIIIQTDKKVYKPGQTVKYRVFGVRSDLQVVCSNYTITVTDPKGNKIQFYTSNGDDYCVVERNLKLPKKSIFGSWKIKVSVEGIISLELVLSQQSGWCPCNVLATSLEIYVKSCLNSSASSETFKTEI